MNYRFNMSSRYLIKLTANVDFETKLRYILSENCNIVIFTGFQRKIYIYNRNRYNIATYRTRRLRSHHIHARALGNIIARLIKESNIMCEGRQYDILKSGLCGVNSNRISRCSYSDRPCRNRARRPAGRPSDLSRWLYRGRVAHRLNYDRTK